MEQPFEVVHEVEDYIDRPLKGVADFRGVRHRFCSVGWISPPPDRGVAWDEWERALLDSWDPDEDRYELVPVIGQPETVVLSRAVFQGAEPGVDLPAGGASSLRVSWREVPIRERLDCILEAQRWGGPPGCDLGTPAYLCLGFWLSDLDLESVRPEFRRDEDYPDVGEVGRYRSVPVFPASERPAERSPWGWFQGVWFGFLPCLCVD